MDKKKQEKRSSKFVAGSNRSVGPISTPLVSHFLFARWSSALG